MLRRAVGQMKMQKIFDTDDAIFFQPAEIGYTHENEQTVSAVNLQLLELLKLRFAVYIHGKRFAVIHPYPVNHKGCGVAVIDHHLHRCASLLREYGVKRERVAREGQSKRRIVIHAVLAAARKKT